MHICIITYVCMYNYLCIYVCISESVKPQNRQPGVLLKTKPVPGKSKGMFPCPAKDVVYNSFDVSWTYRV